MNIAYEYRNIVLANRTTLDCPGLFALLQLLEAKPTKHTSDLVLRGNQAAFMIILQ